MGWFRRKPGRIPKREQGVPPDPCGPCNTPSLEGDFWHVGMLWRCPCGTLHRVVDGKKWVEV